MKKSIFFITLISSYLIQCNAYGDGYVNNKSSSSNTSITLQDNSVHSIQIKESTNNYLDISTVNNFETMNFGNTVVNPSYVFLGSGNISAGGDYLPSGAATRVITPLSHSVGNLFSGLTPEEGGLSIVVPSDGRPIIFWLAFNGSVSALRSARCTDTQCTSLSATANLTSFILPGRSVAPGATILPNGEIWLVYGNIGASLQFAKCSNVDCSALTSYNTGNWGLNNFMKSKLVYNPATGSLTELTIGVICRNPSAGCTDNAITGVNLVDAMGWINPANNFPIFFGRTGTASVRTVCSDDHCGGGSNFFSQVSDIWTTIAIDISPTTGLPSILYASANSGNSPSYTPYLFKYIKCTNIDCSSMLTPVTIVTSSVPTYPLPPSSGIGTAALRGAMGFDPTGKPILSFSLGDGTNEFILCTDDTCATTTTLTRAAGLVNDSMAVTAMTVTSGGDVYAIDGLNAASTSFTFTTTPLGSYVFSGSDVGSLAFPMANGYFSGDITTGSASVTRGITAGSLNVSGSTILNGLVTSGSISSAGSIKINTSVTTKPACASDSDVGTFVRYSKTAGATISMCFCQKVSSSYLWAAIGTGDCT
jgi:hypothetical protein